MIYNLFFNLFIIHILCDFYLQTSSSCENKIKNSAKSAALWVHGIAVGVLSWVAVWDIAGWWLALSIMISHLLIDLLKSYLQIKCHIYRITADNNMAKGDNIRKDLYLFIGDQVLHIIVLAVISYLWYSKNPDWEQISWLQHAISNHPIGIYSAVALLLLLKPVNILILQILKSCRLDNSDSLEENSIFHAGALIGYTERSLILLFVVLSQYEAIGFLIAAKSILRFTEASSGNVKSEYVLCGTLLSLFFSLISGICVLKIPVL